MISVIEAQNINIYDSESGDIVFNGLNGNLRVQYNDDNDIPLVSFVGIPLSQMKLKYADENHADFLFPFSDEEYDTMFEKFGKYCVIINGSELESHIIEFSKAVKCDYIFDKIEYCDQNTIQRIQSFNKASKKRFLYKNTDLAYQREYRLALAIEMPDNHYISIGKLTECKIFKSEKLKNLVLSISYISHVKEESLNNKMR